MGHRGHSHGQRPDDEVTNMPDKNSGKGDGIQNRSGESKANSDSADDLRNSVSKRISRRRMLAITGTSLTVALAGCPADPSKLGAETPTDDVGTETPTDDVLRVESGESYTIETDTTETYERGTIEHNGTLTQESGSELTITA